MEKTTITLLKKQMDNATFELFQLVENARSLDTIKPIFTFILKQNNTLIASDSRQLITLKNTEETSFFNDWSDGLYSVNKIKGGFILQLTEEPIKSFPNIERVIPKEEMDNVIEYDFKISSLQGVTISKVLRVLSRYESEEAPEGILINADFLDFLFINKTLTLTWTIQGIGSMSPVSFKSESRDYYIQKIIMPIKLITTSE